MTLNTQTLKFFDIKIGHFPDRSARWLLQDKENVRGLLEIIARELVDHIDFNQLTQINRSFIPDTLREQEADIVLSVPFKRELGTDEILIYILIEHQSTVDISMGFRVLYYMTQIWDFQRRESESSNILKNVLRFRPILPIVFYTGDSNWKYPLTLEPLMDIPEELSGFIPKFDILFLNVKETDLTELTKSGHPFGWLLTVLQKEQSDKETISRVIIDAISNIINLDKEQGVQLQLAINYFLLLILHRRSADEHEELIKLIDQEVPKLDYSLDSLNLSGLSTAKKIVV